MFGQGQQEELNDDFRLADVGSTVTLRIPTATWRELHTHYRAALVSAEPHKPLLTTLATILGHPSSLESSPLPQSSPIPASTQSSLQIAQNRVTPVNGSNLSAIEGDRLDQVPAWMIGSSTTCSNSPIMSAVPSLQPEEGMLEEGVELDPVRVTCGLDHHYVILGRIHRTRNGGIYHAVRGTKGQSPLMEGKHFALKIVYQQRRRGAALMPAVPMNEAPEFQESRILKRLEHPNVCRLLEIINDPIERCQCIVMPLLRPWDLGVCYETGRCNRMEESAARCFFLSLLRGLRYLHRRGITHRDLKPDNVMVEPDTEEAVIVDFGCSTDQAVRSFAHRANWQRGTAPYWAPEIFNPVSESEVDGKALDVWAYGVMLYCALCGQHPFIREDVKAAATRDLVVNGAPAPPQELGLSEAATELLSHLLSATGDRWSVDQIRSSPFFNPPHNVRLRGYSTLMEPQTPLCADKSPNSVREVPESSVEAIIDVGIKKVDAVHHNRLHVRPLMRATLSLPLGEQ